MTRRSRAVLLVLGCILAANAGVFAEDPSPPPRKLVVGTKVVPPFAMKTPEGEWTGLSFELWNRIAAELSRGYVIREMDQKALLDGVKDGSIDAVVAAMTVTEEREKDFDFTHPFHTTGLSIAALRRPSNPWMSAARRVFSWTFLKAVGALLLLLLAVGVAVWFFERRRNREQFGGPPLRGIGAAFWWSAVTMTTVGYGDKAPQTVGGRLVALVWMFAAILLISSFTAAIASALTVTQLESPIRGPQDLHSVRVGSLPFTTSEAYLKSRSISFRAYAGVREGLEGVASGEIDALVYDAPVLKYEVNRGFADRLVVLRNAFQRQDYAIALPAGSPFREDANRILLKTLPSEEWQATLERYLGR